MSDEGRRRPGIGESVRSGIGVLTAFKEALEETIREAGERGDLKPERAREFLNDALGKAQESVSDVRERLDFVPRREFEELRAEVAELRRRLDGGTGDPAETLALPPLDHRTGGEGPVEARMP